MASPSLLALLLSCAPQVDTTTALALISVESAGNPHAIGVVGGALVRQPRTLPEALRTARALQAERWNFSLGIAQINVRNLQRLGLSLESAFEPCANLGAMQTVLTECYERTAQNRAALPPPDPQGSLRQALSCYYSGNFATGFEHGYVRRVAQTVARIRRSAPISMESS
jgi:type IV secretion system protein VirB1